MKPISLSIALIISSYTIFSQTEATLKPTVHLEGSDTSFCWTVDQSKEIAKQLSEGDYCEKKIKQYRHTITLLDSLVLVKERETALFKQENRNSAEIYMTQKKMVDGYKAGNELCGVKLKRQKAITKIAVGLMAVFAIIAVVK